MLTEYVMQGFNAYSGLVALPSAAAGWYSVSPLSPCLAGWGRRGASGLRVQHLAGHLCLLLWLTACKVAVLLLWLSIVPEA